MLRRRRTRPSDRRPNERGSIIVALLVIFVIVALSSVLAARVIGNQTIVVNRQNTAAGVAGADAGITDALFRIDQGTVALGSSTTPAPGNFSFCVGGASGCVAAGVPGAPGVKYIATANTSDPTQATQWTIQAIGTINGAPGAIQETLTRGSQYPYALFGNSSLDFTGMSSGGFGYYAPGPQGPALTTCPNTPSTPACLEIASNGLINCNGTSHSNNQDLPLSVLALYYSGGGGVSGACGTTQAVSTLFNVPVKSPPAGTYNCPGNGQLGSGITGAPTIIGAPGQTTIYVCNDTAVTISGNLQVAGPVQFYIQLDSSTNQSFISSRTPTLNIIPNSTVNVIPPVPPTTLPDATMLQVFSNSSGTVGDSNGQGFYYGGTIYAPNASLTGDGCQSVYYGSLVLGSFTCHGGPNLTINYDEDLGKLYGPWSTSGYVQIPPGSIPNF
jgi:hypothetical protein